MSTADNKITSDAGTPMCQLLSVTSQADRAQSADELNRLTSKRKSRRSVADTRAVQLADRHHRVELSLLSKVKISEKPVKCLTKTRFVR